MSNLRSTGPSILIEGLDLAGKSTLVRQLVVELEGLGWCVRCSRNALIVDNPIAMVADIERKKDNVCLNKTMLLFLSSHLYDAHKFKKPPTNTVHLQDSSWLRTVAFNVVRGNTEFLSLLEVVITLQPTFDLVIYLTADIESRKKRVLEREHQVPGENDKSDYLAHFDPELLVRNDKALLEAAKRYCGRVDVVDTSILTKGEVLSEVLSLLKNRRMVY